MLVTDETPKAKKGVTWLIALAVVMAVAAIALAVAFAFNSASELHGFGYQPGGAHGAFSRQCGAEDRPWRGCSGRGAYELGWLHR